MPEIRIAALDLDGTLLSRKNTVTPATRQAIADAAARGVVVNEPALIAALKNGEIAGAGLDVLVEETFPADHPFMTMPNVVLTPHMAAQSQETVSKLVTMAAEGTLAVLRGEKWPYVANPEVYDHPRWKQ